MTKITIPLAMFIMIVILTIVIGVGIGVSIVEDEQINQANVILIQEQGHQISVMSSAIVDYRRELREAWGGDAEICINGRDLYPCGGNYNG